MKEYSHATPLAITADLISIVTFLFGIFASYLTFLTLSRSALTEISTLKSDLSITRTQISSILSCCSSTECLAPITEYDPEGTLQRSIVELSAMLERLYDELVSLEKNADCRWWEKKKIWTRLLWLRDRNRMRVQWQRVVCLKIEVQVGHMGLLLK